MMTKFQSHEDIVASVLSRVSLPAEPKPPTRPAARPAWTVPGFDGKARIMTSFGELPIEALRVRDEVRLPDGQFRRVAWIDQIKLDADYLARQPDARPILIGADAFGRGRPSRSFLASAQQEIHITRFPTASTACRVADTEGRRNILRKSCTFIRYYLFHVGEPATVCVEGVWCTVAPEPR